MPFNGETVAIQLLDASVAPSDPPRLVGSDASEYFIARWGGNRIPRMFARLRPAKLPMGEFTDTARLARLGRNDFATPHSPIEAWRSAITKFILDSDTPLPE